MSKLRDLRIKMGLSQMRLAVMAKVNRVTINYIENGKTIPALNTRMKLAKALYVKPNDIE